MQIAHPIPDLQRVGRRFATVCGRLGIVSVAERTDLRSTEVRSYVIRRADCTEGACSQGNKNLLVFVGAVTALVCASLDCHSGHA
jgi:hypothetical protein